MTHDTCTAHFRCETKVLANQRSDLIFWRNGLRLLYYLRFDHAQQNKVHHHHHHHFIVIRHVKNAQQTRKIQ